MPLSPLRDDALRSAPGGFRILVSLPWIRSLPLWSLVDPAVSVDGRPSLPLRVATGERETLPGESSSEDGEWFVQDRIAFVLPGVLEPGAHEVSVSFGLLIPYLPAGPAAPLRLPFAVTRTLVLDAPTVAARLDVAPQEPAPPAGSAVPEALPTGWTLAASAFNLTPEVVARAAAAPELALRLASEGIADTIEIEPGQLWRGFPDPPARDMAAFADALSVHDARVSIVGASIDDWESPTRRRTDDERLDMLRPQLAAAAAVGASGLRLPLGHAGTDLLTRLVPLLEEADLVLFEEAQGLQSPGDPAADAAYEAIAALDHPRVRLLLDTSMLMPALPESYLDALGRGGVSAALLARLRSEWQDPSTAGAIVDELRADRVPGAVHTLFMNLLVRFGRSSVTDVEPVLPLLSGVHLKFWDLDDSDGRVSQPIRDLSAALRRTGFSGTLCSEWGGHEWLDADPWHTTRAHLALVRRALAA